VVAFAGSASGGVRGVYTAPAAGGAFTTVADTITPIPNGSGAFSGFSSNPAVSGSVVAFAGTGSGGQFGVYTGPVGGGALTRVADTSTAVPGGSAHFTSFGVVDVSGSVVAFTGFGPGSPSGIYVEDTAGGALAKLLAVGDTLDGKTVSNLYFNDGLEGSNVAFTAQFTDGSQGIYVGHVSPVPEPSSLLLVAAAGSLTLLARRRRRRPPSSGRPGSDGDERTK